MSVSGLVPLLDVQDARPRCPGVVGRPSRLSGVVGRPFRMSGRPSWLFRGSRFTLLYFREWSRGPP